MSQRFTEPDSGEGLVEEPIDARRYLEALRRHAGLILGLAVGVAVLVFLISLALPKRYSATAQIAPSVQATASAASGSTSTQLNLATLQAYVTSPTVLATAARRIGGETEASLSQKITTSLDSSANIVDITARDSSATRAAELVNGVARTFLSVRTAAERAQLAQQVTSLTGQMQAARAAGSRGLASALQQQISSVFAEEASAGSDLQLLAPAAVPGSASSPRPTRNASFAFIVVLFIGVLAVGAQELLAPSILGGRELSALMRMPILGQVPRVTSEQRVRRTATDPAEAEAYRFLSKSLELSVWPNRSRLIAVTSAVRGEGKTTVVSRLGAAFAETGSRTLLVSADLRWPALDRVFGLPSNGGLSSVLGSPNGRRRVRESSHIERVGENLYVLPSGPPPADPAVMLTNDVVQSVFERLRKLDFAYVLFDLPPLITVAETQLFVRHADAAMLVSMVGRAGADELSQTRELLNRLPVWSAGIVVLGVRAGGRLAPRNVAGILARPDDGPREEAGPAPVESEPVSHPAPAPLAALPEVPEPTVLRERPASAALTELPEPVPLPDPTPPPAPAEPVPPASPADPPPAASPGKPTARTASTSKARPASRRQPRQKASAADPSQPKPTRPAARRRRRPEASPGDSSPPAPPPERPPPK